jgi:hypothetical protein
MTTVTAPGAAGGGPAGPVDTGGPPGTGPLPPGLGSGAPPAAELWRRWRAPAVLIAAILLAAAVIALLQASPRVTGPLDPRDTGPGGAHALVALLTQRGQTVDREVSAPAAARQAGAGTTLVVTSPWKIPASQLATLAASRASLVLVAPGRAALSALTPGVTLAGIAPVSAGPPACGLPAATLAGKAITGGLRLRTVTAGAWRCYPARAPGAALPSLVRYLAGGRIVTVLGTGAPLANQNLGRDGDASLALNLLGSTAQLVWLVPGPAVAALPARRSRSVESLIPWQAYAIAAQLAVAALLAALWRVRRFGPLVTEPLPVLVRASETALGHGGLYRSRRARGRAANALRTATVTRLAGRLGLPRASPPAAVCQEVAHRSGRDPAAVREILFGPAPRDDAALVALATSLDTLEGQVLTQ